VPREVTDTVNGRQRDVLVPCETPFGMITWGNPESGSLPLPSKLTTPKISPRPFGPQHQHCATSARPFGPRLSVGPRRHAPRHSALWRSPPRHCTRRRFFACSTAWLATFAQQINHTQNFASAFRASTFGPAGLSINTVPRRLGPSGLAFP